MIVHEREVKFSALVETDRYACNGRHVYILKHCLIVEYLFINQMLHFFFLSFLPVCSCECSPVSGYHTY